MLEEVQDNPDDYEVEEIESTIGTIDRMSSLLPTDSVATIQQLI